MTDQEMLSQIDAAKQFIDCTYLDSLSDYRTVRLAQNEMNPSFIRLYHLTKIVYDKKEDIGDKLTGVFNSVMPFCNTLVLLVKGSVSHTDLYLGVRSKRDKKIANEILHDSFLGNFSGSRLSLLKGSETASVFQFDSQKDALQPEEHFACMNVLPSRRGAKNEEFVQGLEKFIDTMRGSEYICEVLVSPMTDAQIEQRMSGFEELYSALSPFEKKTMSHGHNEGKTLTDGITDSISHSISNGISKATGTNQSHSHGKSSGFNMGMHFLLNFGMNSSTSDTDTVGTSTTDGVNTAKVEGTGTAKQHSESVTTGTTDSMSMEYRNKNIENLLEKINTHIKRLKEGHTYGMWESAVYFIAPKRKDVAIAASAYRSLMLGDNTGSENVHLNMLGDDEQKKKHIRESLSVFEHPRFQIPFAKNQEAIAPVNYVNGQELPLLLNLPRKSVSGITVSNIAEFGRNVLSNANPDRKKIKMGSVFHMGQTENTPVELDFESLTSHCFVTGSTGSGKSNTVYHLIERVSTGANAIPFLVIEPAKGEYRDQFRQLPGINLFTTNPQIDELLKLNPFSFCPEIHILEHLDKLVEIFNTCWEMYAAMPAILKEAMEEAYVSKGWDLLNSVYTGGKDPEFPTFHDVLQQLPKIINRSSYSADTKGDYIGSLVTRVSSMTNGIYGQIFCDDFEVENATLFDQPTIVDLSRVGSSETKSLIMGVLILKLNEYRMAKAKHGNSHMRHITVLEEAHNILKNTSHTQGAAGSTVIAKSVEMIVNGIAEMRTYGESFIIVDQSPTSVDIAAVKNTNTKIIMRLPEKEDCKLAGHAVALNEQQVDELSRLETGVAVVMQNNWEQPVLTKIDRASGRYEGYESPVSYSELRAFKNAVIADLLDQFILSTKENTEQIYQHIDSYDIVLAKKKEMKRIVSMLDRSLKSKPKFDSLLFGRTMLRMIGCSDSLKRGETLLKYDENGKFTQESSAKWKKYISDMLDQYVVLNDRQWKSLLQYILHAKKFEGAEINRKYALLYRELFPVK